jgi:surfactin synthase thioesterase subunit
MPYAGGGIAPFRLWFKSLPEDVEVLAAQLPGREARLNEAPLPSIATMVETLQPAVDAAADLPYAIFGHSMGALLAFELTAALEASGCRPPTHLFVSAHRAPDEENPDSPMHALPEPAFLDEMQRRYAAIPDEIRNEPELLALLLPTLRADLGAVETYTHTAGRMVRCPVSVYGGEDDVHPRPDQLAGWSRVTGRPARVRLYPGGHFYLHTQGPALIGDLSARWDPTSSMPVPS